MRWLALLPFGAFASILGYLGWLKLRDGQVPLRNNEEAMVLLGACAAGWFLAIGGFFAAGNAPLRLPKPPDPHKDPQKHAEWLRAQKDQEEYERRLWLNPRLEKPLELRHPRGATLTGAFVAILAGVAAVALFRSPDFLWTRWLSWPVSAILMIVAVVLAIEVPFHWKKRFLVTEQGINIHFKGAVNEIPWARVKSIKEVHEWVREYKQGWPNYKRLVSHYISLRDSEAKELLRIDFDWVPGDQLRKLLEYAPARTRCRIEPETRGGN